MINTARGFLNGLSKNTKTVILNGTMLLLLALGLLFIFLTTGDKGKGTLDNKKYSQALQGFHQSFQDEQGPYRRFAFYETYDELIFTKKQLDDKYKQAINQYSNLTQQQFQEFYTIITAIARKKGYQEIAQFQDDYYYDWQHLLPPVKNMRDYDGSYIFAAVAEMEFEVNKKQVLFYRQRNETFQTDSNWITLSEQEVIDCCPTCLQKKRPQYVYKHFLEYGISRDNKYPYDSSIFKSTPQSCKTKGSIKEYKIKGWFRESGCTDLGQHLRKGPAVVWVDAREWRDYNGGIVQSCGSVRNHYALLVGRGIGYWKIRNSWGVLWGEHGHIRLKYGNTCGICGHSSFIDFE